MAFRDFVPAGTLLLLGLLGLAVATLRPSAGGGELAVIAPPWYDRNETVALILSAGGSIIRPADASNMIVVRSDDPRFVGALYGAGAWFVIDPRGLHGCGDGGLREELRQFGVHAA